MASDTGPLLRPHVGKCAAGSSLLFPKDSYTVVTKTVSTSQGNKVVTYHLYQHLPYVAKPVDANYESLNVSVPVLIDGVAMDATNAPILFEINVAGYSSSSNTASGVSSGGTPPGGGTSPGGSSPPSGGTGGPTSGNSGTGGTTSSNADLALAAGYVVVSPGCRGRDNVTSAGTYYGKAPAAIVDLKAAVRYIRYNQGVMPGNVNWIIATGGSAGGALATLLGASGNSTLYDPYLTALGAAEADDNIWAVAAYSPITNLEHADMAYEWEYGAARYNGAQVNQTISGELKSAFADYQNGLALTGDNSYGPLTADNINDYILKTYLIPSAQKYLSSLSASDRSSYLASHAWISWDNSSAAASFTFADYVSYIGRGKGVPAFDSFFDSSAYSNVNTSQTAEVLEFGNSTTNARHFTNYSLQKTTGDASQTISADMQTVVNLMNPMYFIGAKNRSIAKYWFIRDGAKATDTSCPVIIDLATSLENLLGAGHVNAWEYWDGGHAVNQDPDVLFSWIANAQGPSKTVAAGQTWSVATTTSLGNLTIESGGTIVAPSGYSVTMTVDGVETGQQLATTSGVSEKFVPGSYTGDIVLTVTKTNSIPYQGGGGSATFPIRQALYLDATGVVQDKSVPAAATYDTAGSFNLKNLSVTSTGEDFDAVYATGGSWKLDNATITLTGNGRSDFAGYGTALVATGTSTKLIVDGATIGNQGVVRNAVVATGGANVIVKNSTITTRNGTLPTDYAQTVNTSQMRSVPWMLGINGTDNVRATNLLGTGTKATYINSTITSEGWGTLSTDEGSNCTLAVLNSTVNNQTDGYGSYIIGNATENFLGATINVGGYAAINTGGVVNYGDSTAAAVSSLNSSLGLGLSSAELAALTPAPTMIQSSRFGVMWHSSSGTVNIGGGTAFNTAEAVFLAKTNQAVTISVDGSGGAKLNPANGIILQVMDDDDPGPVNSMNTGVYTEPTGSPSVVSGFNATSTSSAVQATFSKIALTGDFYNGAGWGVSRRAEHGAHLRELLPHRRYHLVRGPPLRCEDPELCDQHRCLALVRPRGGQEHAVCRHRQWRHRRPEFQLHLDGDRDLLPDQAEPRLHFPRRGPLRPEPQHDRQRREHEHHAGPELHRYTRADREMRRGAIRRPLGKRRRPSTSAFSRRQTRSGAGRKGTQANAGALTKPP